LSHFSAEVKVGVDGQFLVGGGIDPAFVGPNRDINGASAFVVPADALYQSYFLFGNFFGIQFYLDFGG